MATAGTATAPHAPAPGAALTFGVLGPLEVRHAGSVLDIRGPQERALLALLLTAPGRVFSVSAIVAGMWGEEAPTGAEKTVQTYVSRLRRTLPGEAAALVVTRTPGYLASIDRGQVDAERFRSLVADGHRDMRAGQAASAGATLRQALGLWRGEAYAEFEAPFATAERAVLEELRVAALEERVSADLGTGAGPELVGELESLVAAHPLRERLWSQLMTALYRAGRQGDAIHAYRRARACLVEQLGVDPGPDLRATEAAVLAHDPRLLGDPAGAGMPTLGMAGPSGASGEPALFGREEELAILLAAHRAAAAGGHAGVLVTGPPGAGKSRLLAELARRVRALGGTVRDARDLPFARPPAPFGRGAALVVLDDLAGWSPAELAELALAVRGEPVSLLLVGACTDEELRGSRASRAAELLPDRLALRPLPEAAVEHLVRLYVPAESVAEVLASEPIAAAGGIPLDLHAAASRLGEDLAVARIDTAATEAAGSGLHLAASRRQVAAGVSELQQVRSLRAVHAARDGPREVCPYKGLAFYDVEDAPYYAGRERLVSRLVARLVEAPLLAVVGPSGSGKSSAVRAGLVAAVGAGLLPGSERWGIVLTSPSRPVPELPPGSPRTLLVVDQFEELFTAVPARSRAAYADWVTAAVARPDISAVVALRSDYYGHVARYGRLAELLAANTVLVGQMTAGELLRAVESPAATAGLELEPGLAATIAADVAGQPGALPLLSTALLSLWERRDGAVLSLADYREIGGVRTAVARLAESAYGQLTPGRQVCARRILLRLAETGEGGEPVRRRAPLTELLADGDSDGRAVLDTLAARRLLTVSATHVEVAHEALLREWPRLSAWLEEDEVGRRLRRHLAPAAAEWQQAQQADSELYRGHRLAAATEWSREHPGDLTPLERDVVEASNRAAVAEVVARGRSIRRLRVLAVGLATVVVLAVAATWVALDQRDEAQRITAAADVRALRAAALGESRWDRALLYAAQAQLFDTSVDARAPLLETLHRSPRATAVLRADADLTSVAVSADGAVIAAGGMNGRITVWDAATGRRSHTLPALGLLPSTIDLSPDGRRAAQVHSRELLITDLGGSPPERRALPGSDRSAGLFTADGSTLVALAVDGRIDYLDAVTGAVQRTLQARATPSAAAVLRASPGRRFMTAADPDAGGTVTAWEVASGRPIWTSVESGGTICAISGDGTTLVIGHAEGRVELVDLRAPIDSAAPARRPFGAGLADGLIDLAWAPDGRRFAGGTRDGSALIWDAETLETLARLPGHSGPISQVAWSPSGTTLYASGSDHSVLAWAVSGGTGSLAIVGESLRTGRSDGITMAPDGSLAASYPWGASPPAGRRLQLLDVRDGTLSEVEVPGEGDLSYLIFNQDGSHLALVRARPLPDGGHRETVRVVDTARRTVLPWTIAIVPDPDNNRTEFTADGRYLPLSAGKSVRLWDVASGRPAPGSPTYEASGPVRSIGNDSDVRMVALSLDTGIEIADLVTGQRLATLDTTPDTPALTGGISTLSPDGRLLAATDDLGVIVWDTRSWKVRSTWPAVAPGGVWTMVFTADSRLLVVGGSRPAFVLDVERQGVVASWDVDPLRPAVGVIVGIPDDGSTVATLSEGSSVRWWTVDTDRLLDQACSLAGRNLTRQEWADVLPDRDYERTCREHPAGE